MKVVDQVLWTTIRNKAGVEAPGYHEGKNVVLFCESWCNTMEVCMQNGSPDDWREFLSETIPPISFLEVKEIGEALALIVSNWFYGDLFHSGLTPIESKMFVEAVQYMTAVQQLAAQDTSKPQKHLA